MSGSERQTLWGDRIIPLLSLSVALAGILSTTLIQYWNGRNQRQIKEYEIGFTRKEEGL